MSTVLPHDRDRLRERRPAPRPRVREDRRRRDRAVSPAARRRRPLPHRDGRARAEGRADRRGARASRRRRSSTRSRRASRRCGQRLGISYDQFIRTTDASAQARRARADRAHLRAQPRRLLREGVRGLVLRRLRVVQAGRRDRRRQVRAASDARRCEWIEERNWFFRLSALRRTSSSALLAEQPGVPAAGEPAQRDARAARPGARGHLGEPRRASRGAIPFPQPLSRPARRRRRTSGSTRCRTTSRRPAIPDAGCDERWPAQLHVIGKDITRFHCDHLAGDARGGRAAAARARVGARLRAARRRAVQQVGRRAARPRRGDRPLRRRRVPLLPAARGAVRRRRQLLVGAVRGALQRRPRERVRQPREPRDLDGRAVLRRRRPGGRARPTSTTRDAADLADVSRGDGRHARLPAARGAAGASGRASRAATSTCDRQAPWKLAKDPALRARARDDARRRSCGSSRVRRCSLAPFMPDEGAGAVGAARRAAARVARPALRRRSPTLDATGWRVQKGEPLFPKEKPAA